MKMSSTLSMKANGFVQITSSYPMKWPTYTTFKMGYNYDYEYGWVFRDDRLGLKDGNDEILLKFLCEMFHPVVRSEKSDWQSVLGEINELIKADGYEIYESEKISGRSVYTYRYCV